MNPKTVIKNNKVCDCGNPEMGFDCVCDWVKTHPGKIEYSCEFCGCYTAGAPRCNKCES
jgi:hypothetical protein